MVIIYQRIKQSEIFPDNLLKAIGVENITPETQNKLISLLPASKYRQEGAEALLRLYFEDNLTLQQIGTRLNLSKERIRQKIMLAVYDLKQEFFKKEIEKW